MNRSQLEPVIRAAAEISGDGEIVVIGSQAIHAHLADLMLSKYAAGRQKDLMINRELVRHGIVSRRRLLARARTMPVDDDLRKSIVGRIKADYVAADPAPRRKRRGGSSQ